MDSNATANAYDDSFGSAVFSFDAEYPYNASIPVGKMSFAMAGKPGRGPADQSLELGDVNKGSPNKNEDVEIGKGNSKNKKGRRQLRDDEERFTFESNTFQVCRHSAILCWSACCRAKNVSDFASLSHPLLKQSAYHIINLVSYLPFQFVPQWLVVAKERVQLMGEGFIKGDTNATYR